MSTNTRMQVDYDGKIIEKESKILTKPLLHDRIKELFAQYNWYIDKFEDSGEGIEVSISHRKSDTETESREFLIFPANIRDEARNKYEKKIQLGSKNPNKFPKANTIVLGVYIINESDTLKDTIFVSYPISEKINYETNPSIRKTFVDGILYQARIKGFYFEKNTRYIGFTSNFIMYFLDNFYSMHYEDTSREEDDVEIPLNINKLENNIQNIYFGAPGTGKSFSVKELIEKTYEGVSEYDNPYVFKTTVYSDYSYFDFVGSVMPSNKEGMIGYDFVPGIFTRALQKSIEEPDKDVFLVIEEMSRGNIASIFGDIFQLLDRNKEGISEYSITNSLIQNYLEQNGIKNRKIYLPSNLHILGTVNTSDQNVNVIDTAFKRRFGYIYSKVDPIVNPKTNRYFNFFEFSLGENNELSFEWNKFYMALNKFITNQLYLSEDKQIGQFFIKFDSIEGNNIEQRRYDEIQNKLLHYLWDDVQKATLTSDYSIFKDEYKTFSELYVDFGKRINIFSKDFIEFYNNLEFVYFDESE